MSLSRPRPLAIVVGFIGKAPVAGMALYNLHYIVGLQQLGYDVHYVEQLSYSGECYDPTTGTFGDDASVAVAFLRNYLSMPGLGPVDWTFIDRSEKYWGSDRDTLEKAIKRADFVLTLCIPTWIEEFSLCNQRAFLDGDPLFTQAAMLDPENRMSALLSMYPTLFTYASRMGMEGCLVPNAGRDWIITRPVVATSLWTSSTGNEDGAFTTVMNLGAWGDVAIDGMTFGHKARELERFIELPRRSSHKFQLAVGGPGSRERLVERGWDLVDPLVATGSVDQYRSFIDGSRGDLGIAKHAYVASKSGWFSDRSTCYLASGRPVLHQQTGFTDWLPPGPGVLPFSDLDDLVDAIERLGDNYSAHARGARILAESEFEARTVIARMLDQASFR